MENSEICFSFNNLAQKFESEYLSNIFISRENFENFENFASHLRSVVCCMDRIDDLVFILFLKFSFKFIQLY